jgi:hypothetical protein
VSRKLDRLNDNNSKGLAFKRLWQKNCEITESNFDDLTAAQAAITAAQAAITAQLALIVAAQADADTAQADATAAARESARISSYPNPGSVLTAADVGTDCTITIANHVRVYPVQGSIDVPDVSITGGALTGKAFSTRFYIYYDDTTLAVTAPTFVATTSSATSQVGAAAGRHFLGFVDTPADGGAPTDGEGGSPPGGGGGSGGGFIP